MWDKLKADQEHSLAQEVAAAGAMSEAWALPVPAPPTSLPKLTAGQASHSEFKFSAGMRRTNQNEDCTKDDTKNVT